MLSLLWHMHFSLEPKKHCGILGIRELKERGISLKIF